MKVFISWSGDLSHRVAAALRDWLPSVIQSLEPYVSSEDIDKGARWSTDIAKELEDSSYGILCITKENVDAAWLNFEAGALSKSVERSRVSPFLFGVKRSEIKGPVLQFQSTIFEKGDVKKLLAGLNEAEGENCLDEARLDQIFEVWWPQLEDSLKKIEIKQPATSKSSDEVTKSQPASPGADILEEVLELVRQQHRLLNSPDALIPEEYLTHVLRKTRAFREDHPVYDDLERSWSEIEALLDSFEGEETIPVSVVLELMEKIRRPVRYITARRRGVFPVSRRRLRPPGED